MQAPSKGRIVLAGVAPETNNGDDTAPAVITRVFGERPDGSWTVNVKVLNDGLACEWKTSVVLFGTEDEARAYGIAGACFWPPLHRGGVVRAGETTVTPANVLRA